MLQLCFSVKLQNCSVDSTLDSSSGPGLKFELNCSFKLMSDTEHEQNSDAPVLNQIRTRVGPESVFCYLFRL